MSKQMNTVNKNTAKEWQRLFNEMFAVPVIPKVHPNQANRSYMKFNNSKPTPRRAK